MKSSSWWKVIPLPTCQTKCDQWPLLWSRNCYLLFIVVYCLLCFYALALLASESVIVSAWCIFSVITSANQCGMSSKSIWVCIGWYLYKNIKVSHFQAVADSSNAIAAHWVKPKNISKKVLRKQHIWKVKALSDFKMLELPLKGCLWSALSAGSCCGW